MLEPGTAIPELQVVLQDGSTRSLSDWGGRWLVLYFYPKDSTPGCTVENTDFSARRDEFERAGAALLGASRDSVKSHQNFCSKQSLRVDLVADVDSALCDAFGTIQEKSLYGRRYLGIERCTFLISPGGRINQVWRKVKVKGHADAVLSALHEAQRS